MLNILSWDCGNLSLAWSRFDINMAILPELRVLAAEFTAVVDTAEVTHDLTPVLAMLNRIEATLNSFFVYHGGEVVDILGKRVKDTSDMERTVALHKYLHGPRSPDVTMVQAPAINIVLIEHQPTRVGPYTGAGGSKSVQVSYQLAYHYASSVTLSTPQYQRAVPSSTPQSPCGLFFVDPRLKKRIALRPDLTYERFLREALATHKDRRNARYAASKKHSKENYLHLIRCHGLQETTKNVPVRRLADRSDTVMQALAWVVDQGLLQQ
jgi:hypothetical protein